MRRESSCASFHYRDLGKRERGAIRRLLTCFTNYSPATLDRLIQQYKRSGQVRSKPRQASQGFRTRNRKEDIRQLVRMGEWH